MILLIKAIACSAIFIAIYYLFLEKEKIHQFNRAYLLLALPLSLCVPLLTLDITSTSPVQDLPFLYQEIATIAQPEVSPSPESTGSTETSVLPIILLYGYISVCFLLLIRFLTNLFKIYKIIRLHTIKRNKYVSLIVVDEPVIPHTFLHYVFISKTDAENEQILTHEFTHARQKHSLDILFIELSQCLFWINPLIFLYKRAIKLNHEFIADDAVINTSDAAEYQQLLIAKSGSSFQFSLASSFSYSLTKKRFVMMTTPKNLKRSVVKITLALLVICSAALLFSEKVYSQGFEENKSTSAVDTLVGATPEMVLEFEVLINQYRVKKNDKKYDSENIVINRTGLPESERARMKEIYDSMTAEQKAKYPTSIFYVMVPIPSPVKQSPTSEQISSWKDSKIYGVWLDGKRINNNELKRIKSADVAHFRVSKLMKNAVHYGQYKFQVDLMTHDYFDKTYPPKSN